MDWFQNWLRGFRERRDKRRLECQAAKAATVFFTRAFPKDKICVANVVERTREGLVVGVTYDTGVIPPPYRFFRVAVPTLAVTQLPDDYWPQGWSSYR
jgi:hypothetical protein